MASGQSTVDSIKIGGIKLKPDQQEIIENAEMGIYYQFSQKATDHGKPVIVNDTLLLAIGNTQSVFLDPYYKDNLEKARKQRIARSLKTRKVEPSHPWVDEVIEYIDVTSDYKEENNGDPVQIYKNRKTQTVTSIYNAFVDNIMCEQKISEFNNWKITEEIDSIFGYPCQKAVVSYGGRNYTAWFTMDIPVNDGPWKFYGLPGLILKVTDNDSLFQFLAVGLQQYKGNAEIVRDKVDYEKCDLKTFNKFVEKERSKDAVSFYHNGYLYMTHKKKSIIYPEMEVIK